MLLFKRFFIFFKPHYKQGIGISIIMFISTFITVVTPFFYKELVDKGIMLSNASYLIKMLAVIMIAMVFQELLHISKVAITLNIRKHVFLKLRMDLYSHFLNMPQSFYVENHRGRLLSRITSDVNAVQNLLLEKFISFIQNLLAALFIFAIIFSLNWQMLFIASVFLPLLYFLYLLFKNKISFLSRNAQEKQEGLMERIQEDLSMVKAIQSFSVIEERLHKTYKEMEETESAKKSLSMRYSAASSSTVMINIIGLFVIWGLGGIEVIEGTMSIGTLIAISFYLNYIVSLFFSAYHTVIGFQMSIPAAERIFEVLDLSPVIENKVDAIAYNKSIGSMEFKNVAFSYNKTMPLLQGVSFKVNKGDIIGLVGKSGQGKTTLANLFLRFYDPDEGVIEMDGIDIKEIKLEWLRRSIAIVPQDDHLFNISIKDNVILGRKEISEEQFVKACELSNVDPFVKSLDDGYDTIVGEHGTRLSAGQKKRISIARAILENPSVLIFDEATAVLDEENEREILDSIKMLSENRIVMIITHKTSNIQVSNKVFHITKGAVYEYNGFEEYIKKTARSL